jgi:hypothetical protein
LILCWLPDRAATDIYTVVCHARITTNLIEFLSLPRNALCRYDARPEECEITNRPIVNGHPES